MPPLLYSLTLLTPLLLLAPTATLALISSQQHSTHFPSHHMDDLSPDELSLFKRRFLAKLGIPESRIHVSATDTVHASSPSAPEPRIPPYLWDIYKDLSAPGPQPQGRPTSDVVRNFFPDSVKTLADSEFHPADLRLTFNLSGGLRPDEVIQGAQLHIRRRPGAPPFRLDVYESVDAARGIARLLDTKDIPASGPDWLALDVSSAALRTIARLDCASECPDPTVRLLVSVQTPPTLDGSIFREPALVLFGGDRTVTGEEPRVRTKRRAGGRHRCRRWPLYVSFQELNWQDWILAPSGLEAGFCSGHCAYPLVEGLNTTNHAIVQSMIHSVSPNAVPAPCCVPTSLAVVSILYIDIDSRIVIKNYPDMMVQGCGCR